MWQNWLKRFGLPECRNETPFRLPAGSVADIVDFSDRKREFTSNLAEN
jgi:hypothetical protein